MKKLLVIILSLLMLGSFFTLAACDTRPKLIVYTEGGFPPFEYYDGKNIVGVDMEIAQYIADQLDMRLVIRDVSFESILAGIRRDNAIGLAGITITAERAEKVDFSIPYYTGALQYVIFPTGEFELNEDGEVDPDLLKGKKLGVQTGTTGDLLASYESEEGGMFEGATVRRSDNALIAIDDMGGNTDYVIIDMLTALQLVSERPGIDCAPITGVEEESYGIAVKKGNTELLEKINEILETLIAEGKIDEWLLAHSASFA